MYQKLLKYIYLSHLNKLDKQIGCKLIFNQIPTNYIDGVISVNMTKTFKMFGLDILKGKNHFTIGK